MSNIKLDKIPCFAEQVAQRLGITTGTLKTKRAGKTPELRLVHGVPLPEGRRTKAGKWYLFSDELDDLWFSMFNDEANEVGKQRSKQMTAAADRKRAENRSNNHPATSAK